MRTLLAILIVVCLLAVPPAAYAQRSPAQVPHTQSVTRIMWVGDSITLGQPGTLIDTALWDGARKRVWERLTTAGVAFDFVGSQVNGSFPDREHEGHGGWSIEMSDAQIATWINQQHPDVILVMSGTNNMFGPPFHDNGDSAPAKMTAFLTHIQAADPHILTLVATIPGFLDQVTAPYYPGMTLNANAQRFNAALPGIVTARQQAGQRVQLVQMGWIDIQPDDGVHPSLLGYQQIADHWYDGLRSTLSLPVSCSQSTPRIAQAVTVASPGVLRVTLSPKDAGNAVTAVSFGARTNVQPVTDLALVGGGATFTVHRTGPGASQLAFTATDACGSWPSFVGGGPNAY